MIKKFLKKIIYGKKSSSENYVKHLIKIGIKIGDDCMIYSPTNTTIDEQYPWMITIGDHVRITSGVIILTHDYSWSVLKKLNLDCEPGAILGASGKVSIGNNVFIGMNSILLRNVSIGDNVIIGVGSVVTKDCESGWVYAGNPAKKIVTVKNYYKKRQEMQFIEAKELAIAYKKRFDKIPEVEVFHEYFMLFTKPSDCNNLFTEKMKLCHNYDESLMYMNRITPPYKTFNDFISDCFEISN